ncbi:hypothetical protein K0I73_09425 [Shewanella mesophila]|uniref:hypothetical protein n=1 Tax=Shewanella mesophila TaxID=2864208 RepID=UPI001C658D7F|nr:hypothetical protein [Shewanella mesophila]QYJ87852.1 hypothetical protein K0I73_09345 [Shewanella mesophila]QYJ87860.1 hypothetical protein K0I73_09385 [Shewanella mesophila]QYJ87868.1 hypothetical protein K0I73_09425 [Shewanella mesophila]
MAQCVAFTAEGYLMQSAQSVDDCTGYILVSPTEYNLAVQSIEINPADMLEVFGIVFGWVVFLGYLSYQVKIAKGVIKRA